MNKEFILLKYISYNKYFLNNSKKKFLFFNKLLYLFWLIKKIKIIKRVKIINGKKKRKTFVLLKSPKCFKRGKLLISYIYYSTYIYLELFFFKKKNIYNINNYLIYFFLILNLFDTNYILNLKIKINLLFNLEKW